MEQPKYGERVAPVEPEGPGFKTQVVNHVATNEHDAEVAHSRVQRSLVRAGGTIIVFAIVMSPLIIGALRAAP